MARGVLAIDHGARRTGFAIADALGIATEPLEPWTGPGEGPELVDRVAELFEERDVGTIVVGLPLHMDGSEGERAEAARALARRLAERFPDLEIALQDERLTSKEAEELMRAAGVRRADRRRLADSYSALVILRDWMSG